MIKLKSGRVIGPGEPVYVIAEAGVNHNGSIEMALELVATATAAGVDAIKFQTFQTDEVISKTAPLAEYQRLTGADSQYDMVKRLELTADEFSRLNRAAKEQGIDFLSTPFDSLSLKILIELGLEIIKIPSGEITNLPFLKEIAAAGLPVILSTGMATMLEITAALEIFQQRNLPVILLQCTTAYPAAPTTVNLRVLQTLREKFGVPVGYSDHTLGNEIALAAVALGACVIEKHFTLDRSLPGPDHAASSPPEGLTELMRGIRKVSSALGSARKEPSEAELAMRRVARKSVVAGCDLPAGTVLTENDLALKRPGTGIAPEYFSRLAGRRLLRDIKADEPLTWEFIEEGEPS